MQNLDCQNQYCIMTESDGKYSVISACRLCGHQGKFFEIMDFGRVPLANAYPATLEEKEDLYPLTWVMCRHCGHVQILETVNPDILFSNYAYASSDSPSLIGHFQEFANTVAEKLSIDKNSAVLEIGCNDGILLKQFEKIGFENLIGVEPATNIAERAMGNGAIIYNDFFGKACAKKIKNIHGQMDLICANNVFAHVANLEDITNGIADLLAPDGVFVFENAYLLDTIRGLYFDQCYFEHLQYYGLKPLAHFFFRFGLQMFDVQRVGTQGGSFRIFVKHANSKKWPLQDCVNRMIMEEEYTYQLYNPKTYIEFRERLKLLVTEVDNFVQRAAAEGKTISCYGCPAKFALFSKVLRLDSSKIKYVVDDSPLKQGRFSPGKKIPIVSGDYFKQNPTDYCLISVWNMADAVMKRNESYGGNWIIPMPSFKIV